MNLCCARVGCWRGSSSPLWVRERSGQKHWSEEHHPFFQVRLTERSRFKRFAVYPWIFLLFTELNSTFGALQNNNINTDLYFQLPKPLKPSARTPQAIHVWVQIDWSGKSPRLSNRNPLGAKQMPVCHLCKSFPTASSSWCWLLAAVRACSPEQVAWVSGLTPLLFQLCRCGCCASCLHLLPSLHPVCSHTAESSFSETQTLDFASAARCCGGGELAVACWGSAAAVGLMYFQDKCSKLHSLLTQAFEKTDVLQQDHFTVLFASYSLFDMAFGEARRNGKTQLNVLTLLP